MPASAGTGYYQAPQQTVQAYPTPAEQITNLLQQRGELGLVQPGAMNATFGTSNPYYTSMGVGGSPADPYWLWSSMKGAGMQASGGERTGTYDLGGPDSPNQGNFGTVGLYNPTSLGGLNFGTVGTPEELQRRQDWMRDYTGELTQGNRQRAAALIGAAATAGMLAGGGSAAGAGGSSGGTGWTGADAWFSNLGAGSGGAGGVGGFGAGGVGVGAGAGAGTGLGEVAIPAIAQSYHPLTGTLGSTAAPAAAAASGGVVGPPAASSGPLSKLGGFMKNRGGRLAAQMALTAGLNQAGRSGIPQSGSYEDIQAAIARDLYTATDPVRQALIGRASDYMAGGVDSSPLYGAYKSDLETQYGRARDAIIGATPAGGALTSALTNLESARARDLAQARGQIDENELMRAINLATGTTNQTMQGLGYASGVQAQRQAAEASRDAAMMQSLGTGLGAYFGSK